MQIYEQLAAIPAAAFCSTPGTQARAAGARPAPPPRLTGRPRDARTRRLVGSLLALLDRPAEALAFSSARGGAGARAGPRERCRGDGRLSAGAHRPLAGVRSSSARLRCRRESPPARTALADSTSAPTFGAELRGARELAAILSRAGTADVLPYLERAAALGRRLFGIEAPTRWAYGNPRILASNPARTAACARSSTRSSQSSCRSSTRRADTLALARLRANLEEREGCFAAANAAIDGAVGRCARWALTAVMALGWTLQHAAIPVPRSGRLRRRGAAPAKRRPHATRAGERSMALTVLGPRSRRREIRR